PSFILYLIVNLTLTGQDPSLFLLPFSTTLTGGTTVRLPSSLFMIPESSMALMISSLEGGAWALLGSMTEGGAGALTVSLPAGCDCLEHPDQVNADNVSVNTTKTPFTLLLI